MRELILAIIFAVTAFGAFLAFPSFRVAVAIWVMSGAALIAWLKTHDWLATYLAGAIAFLVIRAFNAFSSLRVAVGISYALGAVLIAVTIAIYHGYLCQFANYIFLPYGPGCATFVQR